MAAFSAMAMIGLAVAAAGAYTAYEGAQDAKAAGNRQAQAIESSAAEQRKQYESQQRIADIKNARERANLVRQERMARSRVVAAGSAGGVLSSSGVAGGLGSIASQGASNTGFFNSVQANQGDITQSQSRQAGFAADAGMAAGAMTTAQADVSTGQSIFSLGTSIFSAGGGFKTIFDTTKKP